MKKIALVIGCCACILTSCMTEQYMVFEYKPYDEFRGIDFSKYTAQGFLITPELYRGDYESIGLIDYKLMPGARFQTPDGKLATLPYYPGNERWYGGKISISQTLDSVYLICKKMGADALMNFKVEQPEDVHAEITIKGYTISGFAIKRK